MLRKAREASANASQGVICARGLNLWGKLTAFSSEKQCWEKQDMTLERTQCPRELRSSGSPKEGLGEGPAEGQRVELWPQ